MFDEAFDSAAKGHSAAPDPSKSWIEVERRLRKHHANVRLSIRLLPFALAASFLCGAILFGSPSVTNAFHPFIQSMINIQSDVVSLIFQKESANEELAFTSSPGSISGEEGKPIKNNILIEKEYAAWEDASAETVFPSLRIYDVPEGFELNSVILFFKEEALAKAEKAMLFYSSRSANLSYTLTMQQLGDNHSIASGYNRADGEYESVRINDDNGFLFLTSDGRVSLEYMHGDIVITISGMIGKDQIVQIAKGIS